MDHAAGGRLQSGVGSSQKRDGFGGALGFMGYSTVVPNLVILLTNSEPLVGLINMLWMGR